jgi:Response regulator containing a CheY-like receiver domain and an HTH DNA-binding domain
MSTQRRKKSSRAGTQQKTKYSYILGNPLQLFDHRTPATQENQTAKIPPAGGRRSTDVHVIGLLDKWEKLSAREQHLTYLVCKRKKNHEIALEMGVTVGTINSYLHHIYNKLNVRGKMDLFDLFYNFDFRNNPPYS